MSVSCSDKIAKWCYLGVQGALMSILLDKPIYLSSFIIAGGTSYNKESLIRAFHGRIGDVDLNSPYFRNEIMIGQSNLTFTEAKCNNKQPCPTSISWCNIKDKR